MVYLSPNQTSPNQSDTRVFLVWRLRNTWSHGGGSGNIRLRVEPGTGLKWARFGGLQSRSA